MRKFLAIVAGAVATGVTIWGTIVGGARVIRINPSSALMNSALGWALLIGSLYLGMAVGNKVEAYIRKRYVR